MTEPASPSPATSVGLGGDGDEIAAIDEIESEFGVTIDYADAPQWLTAGDVFNSLLMQLSPDVAQDPQTWPRFVRALTNGTGTDPLDITPDSPLIEESHLWRGLGRLSTMLWALLIAMTMIVVLGAGLLSR